MINKQISNHPNINAERWARVEAVLRENEIELNCFVYFLANGKLAPSTVEKQYSFSTNFNMVDATGESVELITPEVIEGQEAQAPYYPAGAIPEILFFKNLPANIFPQTTIWDKIKALVEMRLDKLDLNGHFNS